MERIPGPCPVCPCDWDLEGNLNDHLFTEHDEEQLSQALVRVTLENDRLNIALEVATAKHAKAITARNKAQSRAKIHIAAAERKVFQDAIRGLGGEPVQVQNLYAQLNSRTRQWEAAKLEAGQLRARIAAVVALPIATEDELEQMDPGQCPYADGHGDALSTVRRLLAEPTSEEN